MIHCFDCGADLPDNLAFCLHCGKELEAETPTVVNAGSSGSSTALTPKGRGIGVFPKVAGLVVLLAAIAAGFYFVNQGRTVQQAGAPAANTEGTTSQGGGSVATPTPEPTQDEMPGPGPSANAPDKTAAPPASTPNPEAKATPDRAAQKETKPGSNMRGVIRPMTEEELREAKNPTKIFHKAALCNDGSREYRTLASMPLCDKSGGVKRYLD